MVRSRFDIIAVSLSVTCWRSRWAFCWRSLFLGPDGRASEWVPFFREAGFFTPAVGVGLAQSSRRCCSWRPYWATYATGGLVFPFLVWVLSALAAAGVAAGLEPGAANEFALLLVPALSAAGYAYYKRTSIRMRNAELETAKARNERLSQTAFTSSPAPVFDEDYWTELTQEDLDTLKVTFDMALQPVDEFEGFEWFDQFLSASARYQLNYPGYTLHLMQYRHTPNFHGYLNKAQRHIIEKYTDQRVCGYWKHSSLIGDLSTDFDPVERGNIMLTGWMSISTMAYAANTNDHRYNEPGSLTFHVNDKAYPYDAQSIVKAIYSNYKRSPWTLFSCEPNWLFNMCNMSGMVALRLHDSIYGTSYFDEIAERFEKVIDDEFTTLDGRVIAIRSSRLGFTIPILTSPMADSAYSMWGNAVDFVSAQRAWNILRNDLIRIHADGSLDIDMKVWDTTDTGNYKKSKLGCYATLCLSAREFGDRELLEALERTIEKEYPKVTEDGRIKSNPIASVVTRGMYMQSRVMAENSIRHLVNHRLPDHVMNGPKLTGCEYPGVLVGKAVSYDGSGLDLVLYPGTDQNEQEITIGDLKKNSNYVLTTGQQNTSIISDANGQISSRVRLDGRTEVRVAPA